MEKSGQATVIKYVDTSGRRRCKGGPGLKQSQTYPAYFGECVADLFCRYRADLLQRKSTQQAKRNAMKGDLKQIIARKLKGQETWSDARVGPAIEYLHASTATWSSSSTVAADKMC